jgi:hypothetical protein
MPFVQVAAGPTFPRGLRNNFIDTYSALTADISQNLGAVMELNLPSDARQERYAYFETAPHPRRQDYGSPTPEDAMRAVQFTCVNWRFSASVPWHADDENDDQTKSLVPAVQTVAEHFAILPERVLFEYGIGTVDVNLIPQIPNAPDGAAVFSTTDGSGANRFGATNGNSLSGTGITTTGAIQADFYTALAQFGLFLDTKSQPLIAPELIDKGVIVIAPIALQQVFRQAFYQKVVSVVFGSNTAAAAPSNVVLDTGQKVQLWLTPRLTGHNWWIALTGLKHKPFFKQVREPLHDYFRNEANSDRSRDFLERRWQWTERAGYGISLPYNIIQQANA